MQDLRLTAHHEAGHVVVALALGCRLLGSSIVPDPSRDEAGWTKIAPRISCCRDNAVLDQLTILHAGPAAESLATERKSGYVAMPSLASHDALHAARITALIDAGEDERDAIQALSAGRALRLIHREREALTIVAEALLIRETLDGSEIEDLLTPVAQEAA